MLYRKAPELEPIADELIKDESKHLTHLISVHKRYLFFAGAKGRKAMEYGAAQKLGGLLSLYVLGRIKDDYLEEPGEGFLIFLNHDLWRLLKEPDEKRRVLYHYLLRCSKDEEGRLTVCEPDLRIFSEEVRAWGADLPNVKRLLDVLAERGQGTINFDAAADPEPKEEQEEQAEQYDGWGDAYDPSMLGAPPERLGIPAREQLALPAPPDPNVIEAEWNELPEAALDGEDETQTPAPVAAFLEKQRTAEIGATEDDVPMVAAARRRAARSGKGAEVAA